MVSIGSFDYCRLSNTIHHEHLLAQLNWRYATKQFDPRRKISPQDWAALESALVLCPSSFGLQPWKFIIVNDPAVRERLAAASWSQRQIVDASHLVVFAAKNLCEQDIEAHLARVAQVRGVPAESLGALREMMMGSVIRGMDAAARRAWAERQIYIALGTFLTCAAMMGIDACPMEGIEPEQSRPDSRAGQTGRQHRCRGHSRIPGCRRQIRGG